MTCLSRLLDRVESWLYRRRYEARVREQMRRGLAPLFVVLVLAGGCAPLQARRETRRIESACDAAYRAATTEAEVSDVHERCDAAYEEVRRER